MLPCLRGTRAAEALQSPWLLLENPPAASTRSCADGCAGPSSAPAQPRQGPARSVGGTRCRGRCWMGAARCLLLGGCAAPTETLRAAGDQPSLWWGC